MLRFAAWTAPIVWFVTFVVLVAIAAYLALQSASPSPGVTQLVEIVASWPPVVLVLGIVFGVAFRTQLAAFVERLTEFSLPGGAVLRAPQLPPPQDKEQTMPLAEVTPAEISPKVDGSTQANEVKRLRDELTKMTRETRYWYSLFLGAYIAPVSREALEWLERQADQIEYQKFNEFLTSKGIKDAQQQSLIWAALAQYNLVQANGVMVKATPQAKVFLKYLRGEWKPREEDMPTA